MTKHMSPDYWRKRYHAERAELIEKLGGRCVRCGSTEKLEFDHIESSAKRMNISKCLRAKATLEELKKCQVLCKKCHDKKSQRENSERRKGTSNENAKFSERDVRTYRDRFRKGEKIGTMAREAGVDRHTMSDMLHGKRYASSPGVG